MDVIVHQSMLVGVEPEYRVRLTESTFTSAVLDVMSVRLGEIAVTICAVRPAP